MNILDIHTFLWMDLSRRKQQDMLQYTIKKGFKKNSPKWYFHIQSRSTQSDSKIKKIKRFIIFSNSSVLTSLQGKKLDNLLIIRLLCKLEKISDDNKILLCWIPSHTGISGNEQDDKVARSALRMVPEKKFYIPYTNLKIKINKYTQQQRQHCWSNNTYKKCLEIEPVLGEWRCFTWVFLSNIIYFKIWWTDR